MKIKVKNGQVQLRSLIKPFAIGHVLGWGVFMLPMLLVMIPLMLLAPIEAEEGANPVVMLLTTPVMSPLILVFQGIMLSCMITFGLWIFRSRGKIEIEEIND